MSLFTWVPDYNGSEESKPRVLEAPFGDGYLQSAPDGLNSILRTWSYTFSDRDISETNAILDFLKSRLGNVQFTFNVPDTVPQEVVTVISKSWSKVYTGFQTCRITVKFEEQVPS